MLKYVLLGIIQGVTEFFPVSSSAHLVILQRVLGMSENQVAVSVVLHLGTALAVGVFFLPEVLKALRDIKIVGLIAAVTVITGIIGFSGKDFLEQFFSSPRKAAVALLCTGAILLLTKKIKEGKREKINLKDALVLGVSQGIAIIPGISRSGITISTLLFRKVGRVKAFNFSFLAALPVIFGAVLLEAKEIGGIFQKDTLALIVGFFCSFVSGLIALYVLKMALHKAKFHYFGYYCVLAGILTLVFVY